MPKYVREPDGAGSLYRDKKQDEKSIKQNEDFYKMGNYYENKKYCLNETVQEQTQAM